MTRGLFFHSLLPSSPSPHAGTVGPPRRRYPLSSPNRGSRHPPPSLRPIREAPTGDDGTRRALPPLPFDRLAVAGDAGAWPRALPPRPHRFAAATINFTRGDLGTSPR